MPLMVSERYDEAGDHPDEPRGVVSLESLWKWLDIFLQLAQCHFQVFSVDNIG